MFIPATPRPTTVPTFKVEKTVCKYSTLDLIFTRKIRVILNQLALKKAIFKQNLGGNIEQ